MSKPRPRADREYDTRLVARMLESNEEAFRVFFNIYYPRLVSFVAKRFSRDRASVDDIVQVALIRAMRGLSTYRGDSSLFTWLCAICWREVLTARRKQQQQLGWESLESLPEKYLIELRAPERCEPERVSEAESVLSVISTTLSALPERYVRALEMRYVEGHAVGELATAMGVTVIGAQSLLARARAAFREACSCHPVETIGMRRGGNVTTKRAPRPPGPSPVCTVAP